MKVQEKKALFDIAMNHKEQMEVYGPEGKYADVNYTEHSTKLHDMAQTRFCVMLDIFDEFAIHDEFITYQIENK